MASLLEKRRLNGTGAALKERLKDIADRFRKIQAPNMEGVERMKKVTEAAKKARTSH